MMTMMMMTLLTLYMTPSLRVADFEGGHFWTYYLSSCKVMGGGGHNQPSPPRPQKTKKPGLHRVKGYRLV